MNWTGGRLRKSRRAHIPNAHTRMYLQRPKQAEAIDGRPPQQLSSKRPLDQSSSVVDLDLESTLSRPTKDSAPKKRRNLSAKSSKRSDIALGEKRRKLLHQDIWVLTARSLRLNFPLPSSNKLIGRRRRIEAQEEHRPRINRERISISKGARGAKVEVPNTEKICIRMGPTYHGVWGMSPIQEHTITSSTSADCKNSDEMLLNSCSRSDLSSKASILANASIVLQEPSCLKGSMAFERSGVRAPSGINHHPDNLVDECQQDEGRRQRQPKASQNIIAHPTGNDSETRPLRYGSVREILSVKGITASLSGGFPESLDTSEHKDRFQHYRSGVSDLKTTNKFAGSMDVNENSSNQNISSQGSISSYQSNLDDCTVQSHYDAPNNMSAVKGSRSHHIRYGGFSGRCAADLELRTRRRKKENTTGVEEDVVLSRAPNAKEDTAAIYSVERSATQMTQSPTTSLLFSSKSRDGADLDHHMTLCIAGTEEELGQFSRPSIQSFTPLTSHTQSGASEDRKRTDQRLRYLQNELMKHESEPAPQITFRRPPRFASKVHFKDPVYLGALQPSEGHNGKIQTVAGSSSKNEAIQNCEPIEDSDLYKTLEMGERGHDLEDIEDSQS